MTLASETNDRLAKIAELLLKQTRSGVAAWKPTDDEGAFYYMGSKSSLFISNSEDQDGDDNVRLRILNDDGIEVGELRSAWVSRDPDPWDASQRNYGPGKFNGLLEDLFEAARRSALRIDEVLDSLYQDLSDEPPF